MKTLPVSGFRANSIQQNKKVTFEAKPIGANLPLNTHPTSHFLRIIPGGIGVDLKSEALALREAIGDTGDIGAELRVVEGVLSRLGIEQKPPATTFRD